MIERRKKERSLLKMREEAQRIVTEARERIEKAEKIVAKVQKSLEESRNALTELRWGGCCEKG